MGGRMTTRRPARPAPRFPGRPVTHTPHRAAGSPRRDRGSAAVEITVLAPLLMTVLMLMVFLGRITEARAVIADAAHQAARAASAAPGPGIAAVRARATAGTALDGRGLACAHFTVTVRLARFRPGGTVTATVTCTTGLGDLTLLRLPGSTTLTAAFTSGIDRFRATPRE
jgi:Flp pilus assembly protein TadG